MMLKLKKIVMFVLSTIILIGLNLTIPGYANAKTKTVTEYQYIYYPSSQVYYSPGVHRYYYMSDGTWTYGPAAPVGINLGNGVSINLGGPVPYVYHPTVIQQYPVVVAPY